jgi:methionyl-tRNA formyltransferase
LRIVFMGSPDFAVPSLNALVEAGHDVVAACAQPPRPAGRGKAERKTAVHQRAEQLGIEVRTPRTLRDPEEQERFRALNADYAVVAAYGLILPKPILEAPRHGCINVHASLLPRWRGAAPIQRAILAGDDTSGVTIMQMDEGLDTGPMLLQRELDIQGKNAGQATEELANLGAATLLDWLSRPTPPEPQP